VKSCGLEATRADLDKRVIDNLEYIYIDFTLISYEKYQYHHTNI